MREKRVEMSKEARRERERKNGKKFMRDWNPKPKRGNYKTS